MTSRHFPISAAATIFLAAAAAAAPGAAHAADLPPRAAAAARAIVADGVSGVTVIVARGGAEIAHQDFGTIDPAAQLPIASASKWLTAALIMQLVDEGKLSLDTPIATWLPGLTAESGALTLRQALSQTTGLGGPGTDIRQDHRIMLAESVKEITAAPLAKPAGTTFVYGGPGFQIAGAVVEAVTGKSWEEAFQERIGRPLGMTRTHWTHIGKLAPAEVAETRNPTLQGGAVSTAGDYMRFLEMLAGDGVYKGRRILSHASVEAMSTDHTGKVSRTPTGVAAIDKAHYALGNWCEAWDAQARCSRSSSLGAWGVYPWIDWPTGLYGIQFLYEANNAFRILPHTETLVTEIVAAAPPK